MFAFLIRFFWILFDKFSQKKCKICQTILKPKKYRIAIFSLLIIALPSGKKDPRRPIFRSNSHFLFLIPNSSDNILSTILFLLIKSKIHAHRISNAVACLKTFVLPEKIKRTKNNSQSRIFEKISCYYVANTF